MMVSQSSSLIPMQAKASKATQATPVNAKHISLRKEGSASPKTPPTSLNSPTTPAESPAPAPALASAPAATPKERALPQRPAVLDRLLGGGYASAPAPTAPSVPSATPSTDNGEVSQEVMLAAQTMTPEDFNSFIRERRSNWQ